MLVLLVWLVWGYSWSFMFGGLVGVFVLLCCELLCLNYFELILFYGAVGVG